MNEQVFSCPPSPLPTDYWTRPISPNNREWYAIGGVYPWPYTNWDIDDYGPWLTVPNLATLFGMTIYRMVAHRGRHLGFCLTTAPATTCCDLFGKGLRAENCDDKPGVRTTLLRAMTLRTGEESTTILRPREAVLHPIIVAYYEQTGIMRWALRPCQV